jgi:hypothetical protein
MYNYPSSTLNQAGYTIRFTNFTDWTFASATYVPQSTKNTITLSVSKPAASKYIQLYPTQQADGSFSDLFELTAFGFGKTYADESEYYDSLLLDSTPGSVPTNTTQFSLGISGLGLPS